MVRMMGKAYSQYGRLNFRSCKLLNLVMCIQDPSATGGRHAPDCFSSLPAHGWWCCDSGAKRLSRHDAPRQATGTVGRCNQTRVEIRHPSDRPSILETHSRPPETTRVAKLFQQRLALSAPEDDPSRVQIVQVLICKASVIVLLGNAPAATIPLRFNVQVRF